MLILIEVIFLLLKAAFWIACIAFGFLCLIPTTYLPSGLFDWWDKLQHIFAFFCLSILGIMAYSKFIDNIVIGLFLYGGLIEIFQWLTGWRSGDLVDWLADVFGILVGRVFLSKFIQFRHYFL